MRRFPVLLVAVSILGCGGGSVGSDQPPLQVSVDRNQLDFATFVGKGIPPESLSLSISGGSMAYYGGVSSTFPGVFYATLTPTSNTTATVTFSQYPSYVPAPRQSSGVITLALYADAKGTNKLWSQDIPTTLSVFSVDSGLNLSAFEGQAAAVSDALNLYPADYLNVLNASANGTAWLSASHPASDSVLVSANPAGLTPGSYQGLIKLSAIDASLQVPVSFLIDGSVILPAPRTITLDAKTLPSSLPGTLPLAFKAGLSPAWTASSDRDWLVLDTKAGMGAAALSYSVDLSKLTGVPNWSTDIATIQVQPTGLTPATTQIALQKSLPEVRLILPKVLKSNQSGQFEVAGKGFSQLNGGADFAMAGGSGVTGTIASDTLAILQVGALPVGQYAVSVTTATGLPTSSASLVVADPAALAYAIVPNSGSVKSAKYDPIRHAVYFANSKESALVRVRWSGTQWATDSVPIAAIGDVGVSLDFENVYVVSGSNSLLKIDPDTLQTLATFTLPYSQYSDLRTSLEYTPGLPVTQDNRLWFGVSYVGIANYFDINKQEFSAINNIPWPSSFYLPSVASGDGSKMFISDQSHRSCTLYNANTGSLSFPAYSPQAFFCSNMNRDGSKIIIDGQDLYDANNFNLLGFVRDGVSQYNLIIALLSADGSRAYRPLTASNSTAISSIDVFDTTRFASGTTNFLKLGTIPVPELSTSCPPDAYICQVTPQFFLSDFDNTLFLLGNQNLLVIPIPAEFSPQTGSPRLREVQGSYRKMLR